MVNIPAAAVVLAGGRGSRLGGIDKPGLHIGDRSLLDIAMDAVRDCQIVVVGPARQLPAGVIAARERPAGGGPASALAAGIAALPALPPGALVAVLAADLPAIDAATIGRLTAALAAREVDAADGAVLIDAEGRRQYLIGVWRLDRLQAAIARLADWHERPLRRLLEPLRTVEIAALEQESADVDTPQDWRHWQG